MSIRMPASHVSGIRAPVLISGFTILELLVVMGITVLLMSMGVAGLMGMRRGAEIRGAVSVVQTTLMQARQQAVTKRRTMRVDVLQTADKSVNWIRMADLSTAVSNEVFLSPGVEFDDPHVIIFSPMGNAGVGGVIRVREKPGQNNPQGYEITVWPLTGLSRVVQE